MSSKPRFGYRGMSGGKRMIPLWNGKENLDKWKRRATYNKYPVIFWKLLCRLKITHNYLLVEFHTVHPKTKKDLAKKYGVYECVYCGRTIKK